MTRNRIDLLPDDLQNRIYSLYWTHTIAKRLDIKKRIIMRQLRKYVMSKKLCDLIHCIELTSQCFENDMKRIQSPTIGLVRKTYNFYEQRSRWSFSVEMVSQKDADILYDSILIKKALKKTSYPNLCGYILSSFLSCGIFKEDASEYIHMSKLFPMVQFIQRNSRIFSCSRAHIYWIFATNKHIFHKFSSDTKRCKCLWHCDQSIWCISSCE